MKKFAKISGIIIALIIAIIILIPIVFKSDIKEAIDDAIAENINANVYYDADGFYLSLIPNFPNFTFSMSEFGIAGKGVFKNDTLLHIGKFEFVIDVMSVVSGNQIAIKAITLDRPNIKVLVLEDGKANYDIAMPSDAEEVVDDSEATAFSVSINKWQIIDGNIMYYDIPMAVNANIVGLNHEGSGDFTEAIFDLNTKTTIAALSTGYEGVDYLKEKSVEMDMSLNMDLENEKYTFKENKILLSGFGMTMDGFVQMNGDDINMDLKLGGADMTIQGLLSLIPGVYQSTTEGLTASGDINFGMDIKGTYNDQMMPNIDGEFGIAQGNIKYVDYPIPMEKINIAARLHIPGDNMDNMSFDMPTFSMLIDKEQVSANLFFENLANYSWRFGFDGNLDLEKILKIIPIEGTTLRGKINANMKTAGNMALVEAEKYDQLPTSGSMSISDFYYQSEDLPQGFGIKASQMKFTPKVLTLSKFDATIGKSDMQMTGALSNFIGYAFSDTEVLKGTLNFNSKLFDLNEWMSEEEEDIEEDTTALELVRLPTNIDFVMKSNMNKILYDNLEINDLKGLITIQNGEARLNNVDFELLDGQFAMNGGYNSVPTAPRYDFGFSIESMSIPAAYEAFNSVQTMAPVAKNMTGEFSTDFTIAGSMDDGMMPNYDDMNGAGMMTLQDATLEGDKVILAVSKLTKSKDESLKLDDINITFEIKDGRMYVDPFDVKLGGKMATIAGSNGFDGSIDYTISTEISTGALGSAANSLLSSYTGGAKVVGETVPVNIAVSGTYDEPKVGLAGGAAGSSTAQSSATDTAKNAAKDAINQQKKAAEQKAKEELEKQKKAAEAEVARQKKIAEQKAKEEAERLKKEAEEAAKKEAEKALNGLWKKKK